MAQRPTPRWPRRGAAGEAAGLPEGAVVLVRAATASDLLELIQQEGWSTS